MASEIEDLLRKAARMRGQDPKAIIRWWRRLKPKERAHFWAEIRKWAGVK